MQRARSVGFLLFFSSFWTAAKNITANRYPNCEKWRPRNQSAMKNARRRRPNGPKAGTLNPRKKKGKEKRRAFLGCARQISHLLASFILPRQGYPDFLSYRPLSPLLLLSYFPAIGFPSLSECFHSDWFHFPAAFVSPVTLFFPLSKSNVKTQWSFLLPIHFYIPQIRRKI